MSGAAHGVAVDATGAPRLDLQAAGRAEVRTMESGQSLVKSQVAGTTVPAICSLIRV